MMITTINKNVDNDMTFDNDDDDDDDDDDSYHLSVKWRLHCCIGVWLGLHQWPNSCCTWVRFSEMDDDHYDDVYDDDDGDNHYLWL